MSVMFRLRSLFTDCSEKVCVWNNRFQSIPRPSRPHAPCVTECECLGQNNSWIGGNHRGHYRAVISNLAQTDHISISLKLSTQYGPRSNSQLWKVFISTQKNAPERRIIVLLDKENTFHSQLKRSKGSQFREYNLLKQFLFNWCHSIYPSPDLSQCIVVTNHNNHNKWPESYPAQTRGWSEWTFRGRCAQSGPASTEQPRVWLRHWGCVWVWEWWWQRHVYVHNSWAFVIDQQPLYKHKQAPDKVMEAVWIKEN